MKNSRASERYAKSLLQLALEKKILKEVRSDVDLLVSIFGKSREISNLYLSPIIPIKHKVSVTKKIFENKININTLNLMLNIIYRKRDSLMETVFSKFIDLFNHHNNIVESSITSTYKLDEKTLDDVKKFAKKFSNKEISLKHNINKEIIGGFNLKIGDKMIDCTVSSKINNLRKKLINN